MRVRVQPHHVPARHDLAHELVVLLGLSRDDEECTLHGLRVERVEHRAGVDRVRAVVEREHKAAGAARPTDHRVHVHPETEEEHTERGERTVREEQPEQQAERERRAREAPHRHGEEPYGRGEVGHPRRRHGLAPLLRLGGLVLDLFLGVNVVRRRRDAHLGAVLRLALLGLVAGVVELG